MFRLAGALVSLILFVSISPSSANAAPRLSEETGSRVAHPRPDDRGDELVWSERVEVGGRLARVSPTAAGIPIYWASCGVFDKDSKLVKLFPLNRSRDARFLCGSREGNYGYRHMLDKKDRWEGLTPGTNQSWREIADLAMVKTAWDPIERKPVSGGQQCRSAIIYLVNKTTGATVRSVIVRMYVRVSDWRINTVIPGGWC